MGNRLRGLGLSNNYWSCSHEYHNELFNEKKDKLVQLIYVAEDILKRMPLSQ